MLNLTFLHYKRIRRLLLLKYAYTGVTTVPDITSLQLFLSYKGLTGGSDARLLEGILVLEKLTGRRVFLKPLKALRVGTKFTYETTLIVTLRRSYLFNFLYLLHTSFSYLFYIREGVLSMEGLGSNFVMVGISDIDIFNLNIFLTHKLPKLYLKFSFKSRIPATTLDCFLQLLGLYV